MTAESLNEFQPITGSCTFSRKHDETSISSGFHASFIQRSHSLQFHENREQTDSSRVHSVNRWNIPFKIPPDEISMKWFNLNNLEPKKILPIELRSAGGTFNRRLFIELGGISSSSRSAAKMLEGAGISRVLQPRNTRKNPSQATPLGLCFVTLCLSGGNASRKGNSFIRPQRQ